MFSSVILFLKDEIILPDLFMLSNMLSFSLHLQDSSKSSGNVLCDVHRGVKPVRNPESKLFYVPESVWPQEYFMPFCKSYFLLLSGGTADALYKHRNGGIQGIKVFYPLLASIAEEANVSIIGGSEYFSQSGLKNGILISMYPNGDSREDALSDFNADWQTILKREGLFHMELPEMPKTPQVFEYVLNVSADRYGDQFLYKIYYIYLGEFVQKLVTLPKRCPRKMLIVIHSGPDRKDFRDVIRSGAALGF